MVPHIEDNWNFKGLFYNNRLRTGLSLCNSLALPARHFGTACFSNEVVARVFPGGDCGRDQPALVGCFW